MVHFELLLVKDQADYWEVQGITYSNALLANPQLQTLKASSLAIQLAKQALAEGKPVRVAKATDYSEVQPGELIIGDADKLQLAKNVALNNVRGLMHSNIIGICVLDAMEYLDMYMKLLNAGIFITDANREDKYLEIIEASQANEMPSPLLSSATYEEEQAYVEQKKLYESSQENLANLEKYLNAYDKIFAIKHTNDILQQAKDAIEKAQTVEEVNQAVEVYKQNCPVALEQCPST